MAIDGQTMAKPGLAVPRVGLGHDVSLPSRLVRGACPSLATPMQTGDGLLVRLRPSTAGLTVAQFRQLASAAARHGNGLIEVTARGNLQLRGLAWETVPCLEADIAAAGIVPVTGLTIETPPLSGLDPDEIADARRMAARLGEVVACLPAQLTLAPKLSIIVDGGGQLVLDHVTADIRLTAIPSVDARPLWQVAVGGTRAAALPVLLGSDEQALSAVLDLLKSLDALGPRARGRDLAKSFRGEKERLANTSLEIQSSKACVGIHPLGPTSVALGLQLAFGQIHAVELTAFLDIAKAKGITEIRTAPDHALLLLGASTDVMAEILAQAVDFGFWTDANTPASAIATCAGAGGCASGTYRTKHLAAKAVGWVPELLDGSVVLHLSGCPKGCAHPAASALAVVGMPSGFGIGVNEKASGVPAVSVDEYGLQIALERLARMVAATKAAGESVGDCLTRLGSDATVAALRQE
ncbi:precorrin-3B synthase [Rhizobium tumorigenes]|uniref:Precorrin-3B synthase n=1 Tax=Rhizobium tumorigenes TaxID=2041385 RepID=A0AAF1KE26_9HYPH|nr:precorrin-3B synthase [Rhizobium tumorigenes]WFR97352.1 precorrin-3B synthase [Rhizobium tumorigenes]